MNILMLMLNIRDNQAIDEEKNVNDRKKGWVGA